MRSFVALAALTLVVAVASCSSKSEGPTYSCMTVESLCGTSTAGPCEPTWAAVLADPSYCSRPNTEQDYTCGDYQVRYLNDFDEYTLSFYDGKTGKLTAVMLYGMGPPECVAGSGSFTPPSDCADAGGFPFRTCPDAGADAAPLGPF